jgi:hypothetical protein
MTCTFTHTCTMFKDFPKFNDVIYTINDDRVIVAIILEIIESKNGICKVKVHINEDCMVCKELILRECDFNKTWSWHHIDLLYHLVSEL